MFNARVLIADDHIIFSEGLQGLLEHRFEIVGSVSDGRALVDAARSLNPDVIVADISMPIMNGLAAVRQLTQEASHRVVFLTMHAEAQFAIEAFRCGGMGYVLKQCAGQELIAALDASLDGRNYMTPLVMHEVERLLFGEPIGPGQRVSADARRKAEILQMFVEGRSPQEIGWALNISIAAVQTCQEQMMRALGTLTTAEFFRLALQLGLVKVRTVEARDLALRDQPQHS